MKSVINWSACAEFMLDYSKRQGRSFSRVSKKQLLPYLEASLRDDMRKVVDTAMTAKTIQIFTNRKEK